MMITSTQIGHRHIPCIEQTFDCLKCPPGPQAILNTEDTRLILGDLYKTTTGSYKDHKHIVKSASANRKCPILTGINYMQNVHDAMTKTTVGPPRRLLSTTHDSYRHVERPASLGCEGCFKFMESTWPEKDEGTTLPPGPEGQTRFLDPYFTTYRLYHRAFIPYAPEKTITFYSEAQERKESKKPPDPSKNMCLGRGHPNVKINYDRVLRRKPIALKSGLSSTTKSQYLNPVSVTQKMTKDLMNAGIKWNSSKYYPFKCKLA